MRYIIVGKSLYGNDGNLIDGSDWKHYWELGWEISVFHVLVKEWFLEYTVNNNDTIVTRENLEFLYTNIFKNVISYKDFLKLYISSYDQVIEIKDRGFRLHDNPICFDQNTKLYYKYDKLKNIVTDINLLDVNNLHKNESYACTHIRTRKIHHSHRNTSHDITSKLISKLLETQERVFILKDNESHLFLSDKVIEVNLHQYASLVNNPICNYVIGPLSGPYHLVNLLSNAKEVIVILHEHPDHAPLNQPYNEKRNWQHYEYPMAYIGKSIRYSTSNFKYFYYSDDVIDKIFNEKGIM